MLQPQEVIFLKFSRMKPDYFSLNMWNVPYFGPACTVQCPEWATFQLWVVDITPEWAKCENVKFRQFFPSVFGQ